MAVQTTDPVIQIVDRYEQDVRPRYLGMSFPGEKKQKDGNCDCLNESDCSSVIHVYFFSRRAATKGIAVLLIYVDSSPSPTLLLAAWPTLSTEIQQQIMLLVG